MKNTHISKPIALVGFMSSGKSSVGKQLANKLKLPFVDTDEGIEKIVKKPIHHYFKECDEGKFRDLESETLKKILQQYQGQPVVIATGGGILEREENRQILLHDTVLVYLKTSFKEIERRILQKKSTHHILWDRFADLNLYTRREQVYAKAHITIETDGKTVAKVVGEIIRGIGAI